MSKKNNTRWILQDVEQQERGHQWPFSCYSPAKDCASVPGLDDISPEEVRFEAYQVCLLYYLFLTRLPGLVKVTVKFSASSVVASRVQVAVSILMVFPLTMPMKRIFSQGSFNLNCSVDT